MGAILGLLIAIVISAFISGLIIWVVSKFDLGLHVDSFGWAMLAGLLIGAITNAIQQFVPATSGVVQILVNLLITAAVIFGCGALLRGLTVRGYAGALVAAVSIAVVGFLLLLLLVGGASLVGQAVNP
ncbi:MAG: phage holin family protein [Gammaproteobacteria bacterium]|jgi:uncharacterized membrane protein YvlD (DUF360 family)